MGASFSIGRSALAAYQAAISVVGQNIANLANPGYTRQSGRLEAQPGGPVLGGVAPGAGVRLTELTRHIDEAIERRLRLAAGERAAGDVTYQALSRTEALYNELTEQDISSQLGELFAAFSEVQTLPRDGSPRNLVIAAADALVASLRRHRTGILEQFEDLNEQARAAVGKADRLAAEIAALNPQIVGQTAQGSSGSSALRDRRDALLRELAELMDIEVREQSSGAISVYVGSQPLIEFSRSRGLTTETVLEDGLEVARVRFADNNGPVTIRGGQLAGILGARDTTLGGQLERLDTLARGLIWEVNRVHSTGVGLKAYSALTGNYNVDDPDAALNSSAANLPFPVVNGTFLVHVRDTASGSVVSRQIEVDLDGLGGNDTTLTSLAAALSTVPGLTAVVTSDNRLQITADAGQQFWFTEDSSGALAALGLAGFFRGTDAATIEIDPLIRSDPDRIASSVSGQTNDGTNAGRLAALLDQTSDLLGGRSLSDYHAATINDLAVATHAASATLEAADVVLASLTAQRESISGVNVDEEAIRLTQYERAFQGASRFLSVVDGLTGEVLRLL